MISPFEIPVDWTTGHELYITTLHSICISIVVQHYSNYVLLFTIIMPATGVVSSRLKIDTLCFDDCLQITRKQQGWFGEFTQHRKSCLQNAFDRYVELFIFFWIEIAYR